jgi:hypothetical protein
VFDLMAPVIQKSPDYLQIDALRIINNLIYSTYEHKMFIWQFQIP